MTDSRTPRGQVQKTAPKTILCSLGSNKASLGSYWATRRADSTEDTRPQR